MRKQLEHQKQSAPQSPVAEHCRAFTHKGRTEGRGCLLQCCYPWLEFPWVLLVATNQPEWLLLRGIFSVQRSPTIHPSPLCVMDVGWWQEGGRWRADGVSRWGQWGVFTCVSGWPQALYCHPLPSFFLIILSLQPPWHLLDTDTFLILSHRSLFWLCGFKPQVLSRRSTLYNLCGLCHSQNTGSLQQSHKEIVGISNQGHRHLGEFNSFKSLPHSNLGQETMQYIS